MFQQVLLEEDTIKTIQKINWCTIEVVDYLLNFKRVTVSRKSCYEATEGRFEINTAKIENNTIGKFFLYCVISHRK